VEEPAGTIFISAKPDPIRRRRSEPANNPGTERRLPESRATIEQLDDLETGGSTGHVDVPSPCGHAGGLAVGGDGMLYVADTHTLFAPARCHP
jgi:hypothetical protein